MILCGVTLNAQNGLTPKPYELLHPPHNIASAKTMYNDGTEGTPVIPPKKWTNGKRDF